MPCKKDGKGGNPIKEGWAKFKKSKAIGAISDAMSYSDRIKQFSRTSGYEQIMKNRKLKKERGEKNTSEDDTRAKKVLNTKW